MKFSSRKMVLAALCLALCMFLPLLTGQIPQIGNMLSPMHIPVLLCGFVCGWPYGLVVGFISPLLRSAIFGMPPMVPIGIPMAFELAAYGIAAGVLYQALPKKTMFIYVSLIFSMIIGRCVWGIASMIIYGLMGNPFTFAIFLSGAFIKAIPGIICHIIIIPLVVIALERSNLIENAAVQNA